MLHATNTSPSPIDGANLVLLRGLPGAGRSILANQLGSHRHFEAGDHVRQPDGAPDFDPLAQAESDDQCLQQTIQALLAGDKVVVVNTFRSFLELRPYFALGVPTIVLEANDPFHSDDPVPEASSLGMRHKWRAIPEGVVTDDVRQRVLRASAPGPPPRLLSMDGGSQRLKDHYLAWVLTEGSRRILLDRFPPRFSQILCHHITVQYDLTEDILWEAENCHAGARVQVVAHVSDASLECLVVSIGGATTRKDGSTYHITHSLENPRRPVDSNALLRASGFTPSFEEPVEAVLMLVKK